MKNTSINILSLRAGLIIFFLIVLISSISFAMDSTPAKNVNINKRIRQGIDLYDKGEYEGALKYFMRLDKSYPDNGNLHYEIANTCYVLEDYGTALDFAERARDELPGIDKIYILLGNIFDNLNNPEEAVNQYMKAVRINPESDSAWFNLGIAYYNEGKYSDALDALKESLNINRSGSSTLYALGYTCLRLYTPDMAEKFFRRFIELEKDSERSVEVRNVLKTIILSEQKK